MVGLDSSPFLQALPFLKGCWNPPPPSPAKKWDYNPIVVTAPIIQYNYLVPLFWCPDVFPLLLVNTALLLCFDLVLLSHRCQLDASLNMQKKGWLYILSNRYRCASISAPEYLSHPMKSPTSLHCLGRDLYSHLFCNTDEKVPQCKKADNDPYKEKTTQES